MKSRDENRGFSLVELIVVIAVLGILAAILIPVVGNMRARAQLGQSTSNLRHLQQYASLYINSNGGQLPYAGWAAADPRGNWYLNFHQIDPDVFPIPIPPIDNSATDGLRFCPLMLAAQPFEGSERVASNYAMNYWISIGRTVFDSRNISTIKDPASSVMFSVGPWNMNIEGTQLAFGRGSSATSGIPEMVLPSVSGKEAGESLNANGIEGRSTPAVFADGHVEVVESERFLQPLEEPFWGRP